MTRSFSNRAAPATQTAVQGLFAAADTNRDGQMSPTEINAAVIGAARSASQASFQTADADKSGSLSKEEFVKSLTGPAHVAFDLLDADADGQLSQKELDQARRTVINQLGKLQVNEPQNSLGNLIKSGLTPEQVAPVPSFGPLARPPATPRPRRANGSSKPKGRPCSKAALDLEFLRNRPTHDATPRQSAFGPLIKDRNRVGAFALIKGNTKSVRRTSSLNIRRMRASTRRVRFYTLGMFASRFDAIRNVGSCSEVVSHPRLADFQVGDAQGPSSAVIWERYRALM